jgi:hypothetical protein
MNNTSLPAAVKPKPATTGLRWFVITFVVFFALSIRLWEHHRHVQKLKALRDYKADHDRRLAKIDLSAFDNPEFDGD